MKLRLGALLSVIVLLSLSTHITYANNIQAAFYHVHVRDSLTASPTDGASVINPKVEYFSNNTWNTLNLSASVTPTVLNDTLMRFTATIFYTNFTQMALLDFIVKVYNETNAPIALYLFTYAYPQQQFEASQILNQNTAVTAIQSGRIAFPDPTLSYFLQIGFLYQNINNASDVHTTFYQNNVSIKMETNLYAPPDVIVWMFYGVTLLIIAQVTLGFLGSRYLKGSNKVKKFN